MKKTIFLSKGLVKLYLMTLILICPTLVLRAEENAYTLTIKTNQSELLQKGVLKDGQNVGKIFLTEGEASPVGSDGIYKAIIPLKGHAQWKTTWGGGRSEEKLIKVHVKAVPPKGLMVEKISWNNVAEPNRQYEMDNDALMNPRLIKGDVEMRIVYALEESSSSTNEAEDSDDKTTYFAITHTIKHGKGTFEVRHADEEGGKYILEKDDFLQIEVLPDDDYKIGYVTYDGKVIKAHEFNSYGIYSVGDIKKDMHFDVFFVHEDGSEDHLISTGNDEIPVARLQPYPNPCTAYVELGRAGLVSIYDLDGRLLQRLATDTGRIEVADLPRGSYLFELIDEAGGRHIAHMLKH